MSSKKNINSLEQIRPLDSGLKSFDSKKFNLTLNREIAETQSLNQHEQIFYRLLGFFLTGQIEKFSQIIQEDPSLVSSLEIKALKILAYLKQNQELTEKDIFPFTLLGTLSKRKISENLARKLAWLIKALHKNISGFDLLAEESKDFKSKLWKLNQLIPEFTFHYSLLILEEKITDQYENLFKEVNAYKVNLEDLFDAEEIDRHSKLEKIWKNFLLSLYYRRLGNTEETEKYLQAYREVFDLELFKPVKIEALGNSTFYPRTEVLANWEKILEEADGFQREAETLAGLYTNTCEYFNCSDCCSHTFPIMSLTEFKYLSDWLEKNNYDIEKIRQRSEEIQEEHLKLYGSRLEILDKTLPENLIRGVENPHGFKFRCPFLEEGKCSIHPARPLICRGFGSSTDNEVSIKTCNFYQTQFMHNAGPENKRYAYDLRQAQMLARSSDKTLTDGKELKGTLVAWFAQKFSENT